MGYFGLSELEVQIKLLSGSTEGDVRMVTNDILLLSSFSVKKSHHLCGTTAWSTIHCQWCYG